MRATKEVDANLINLLENGLITTEDYIDATGHGSTITISDSVPMERFAEVMGGTLIPHGENRWEYVETQHDSHPRGDDIYDDEWSLEAHYMIETREDPDGSVTPCCTGIYVVEVDPYANSDWSSAPICYEISHPNDAPCNFCTLLLSAEIHERLPGYMGRTGIVVEHYDNYFESKGKLHIGDEATARYESVIETWDKEAATREDVEKVKLEFAGLCKMYDMRAEEKKFEAWEKVDTDKLYLSFSDAVEIGDKDGALEDISRLDLLMMTVENKEGEFKGHTETMQQGVEAVFQSKEGDKVEKGDKVPFTHDFNIVSNTDRGGYNGSVDAMDRNHYIGQATKNFANLCKVYEERSEAKGISGEDKTDTKELASSFEKALEDDDKAGAREKLDELLEALKTVEEESDNFDFSIDVISEDVDQALWDADVDSDDDWEDPVE